MSKIVAVRLWEDWGSHHYARFQHWYEPCGKPISLLTCKTCFQRFGSEYSVGRGVRTKDGDMKHVGAVTELQKALSDRADRLSKPGELDAIARELFEQGFTNYAALSLVSKVAAFLHPSEICPFDSFAKAGVKLLNPKALPSDAKAKENGRDMLRPFQDFCRTLRKDYSQSLDAAYSCIKDEDRPELAIFKNRIIDLYLMSVGGRFDKRKRYLDDVLVSPIEKQIDQCRCEASGNTHQK